MDFLLERELVKVEVLFFKHELGVILADQNNNLPKNTEEKPLAEKCFLHNPWLKWGVVLLVVITVSVLILGGNDLLADAGRYFQKLSDLIAAIDDLIVRLLGTLLLVVGAIGFAWHLVQKICDGDKNESAEGGFTSGKGREFWKLTALGAAMGAGGLGYFGAYELDKMDYDAEEALFGSAAVSQEVLASWVQVVPEGSDCSLEVKKDKNLSVGAIESCPARFSVRTVVSAKAWNCPQVTVTRKEGATSGVQMTERGPKGREVLLGFRSIKVCEGRISGREKPETVRIDAGGKTVKIYISDKLRGGSDSGRIVAFGDTGCREKEEQRCGPNDWPVADIMKAAAGANPDMVLHLGDFMYARADNWEGWRTAFFEPAKELLGKAPWLVVRGNHEACNAFSHGPYGYSLFFGLGPFKDCKKDEWLGEEWLEPTYAVDLFKNLRIIVADSSIARADEKIKNDNFDVTGYTVLEEGCDFKELEDKDKNACEITKGIFKHVNDLGATERTVWLATHVPVFGLELLKRRELVPETTAMMLAAWQVASVKNIKVIISGDRHLFQVVKSNDQPLQITVGTGGVNLDPAPVTKKDDYSCLMEENVGKPDELKALDIVKLWALCSNESWGYVLADPDKSEFKFEIVKKPN